jgi:hypothetical protein
MQAPELLYPPSSYTLLLSSTNTIDSSLGDRVNELPYLYLLAEQDMKQCLSNHTKATGNDALDMATCIVCAQWDFLNVLHGLSFKVNNVPNSHLLVPIMVHHTHELSGSILVHKPGLSNGISGCVCLACHQNLSAAKVPPLSLANGRWIGNVPLVLEAFTISKCILIALAFPPGIPCQTASQVHQIWSASF